MVKRDFSTSRFVQCASLELATRNALSKARTYSLRGMSPTVPTSAFQVFRSTGFNWFAGVILAIAVGLLGASGWLWVLVSLKALLLRRCTPCVQTPKPG
ncbi:hypothetical protein DFP72DRAFT_1052553 [Ephemerocybe angulata]|uniref:Uncharacterized protein n=1 Tax=Ephemerocybe angulata TaxID=980116 RepID=A0A8H6HCU2_9AGAR|nr:hypothetical protein DFP72DRAFT_1052553 [Tulosesus angulatus]